MARARGLPTSIACERAAGTSFNFMTLLLNLFWVISVNGEHCLHLASLGLPHWAGVGGPLVSGIDCRYTGCPARNTNNQYPPPPPNPHRKPISKLSAIKSVCQKTYPNISDVKYNLSIKVSGCQYPLSIELRYRSGADGRAQLSILSGSFGGQSAM